MLAFGGEARADDSDVAWARIQQQELPAFAARLAAAEARSSAARDYFAGTVSLGGAFPELAGGRLGSESWLRGRLALLDDAGARRASERVVLAPPVGAAVRETLWRETRAETLDAEDAASILERRVLLGLLQLLEDHPLVRDEALASERERLKMLVAGAERAWAEDPTSPRAREVAILQEDEALLEEVLSGIRRAATSPGATLPDPSRDLDLLRTPGRALAAMGRLILLEPFLNGQELAQVRAGEIAALEGPARDAIQLELDDALAAVQRVRGTDPVEDLEVLQDRLAEADADLEVARRALAALPVGSGGTVEGARRELAALRLEVARTWRDAAVMAVEVKQAGSRAVLDARYRAERAAAAREKAARAESSAETPEEWAAAALRMTQASAAEETARQAQLREQVRSRLNALRAELLRRQEFLVSKGLGTGDYGEARQLVADLRGHLRAAERGQERLEADAEPKRAAVAEARGRWQQSSQGVSELEDELMQSLFQLVLADWDEALDGQLALIDAGILDQVRHRERLQEQLQRARWVQVEARSVATVEELHQDRDTLVPAVRAEWALVGDTLGEVLQERWTAMVSLGRTLDSGESARGQIVRTASGVLVLVIVWVWLRRRSGTLADLAVRFGRRGRRPLRRDELRAAASRLEGPTRAAVDLAVCWAFLAPGWSLLPELAVAVRVVLSLATWRLVDALFDALVAEHPDSRPALFTLMPEGRSLARLMVQGLTLWAILQGLGEALVLAVLGSVPLALAYVLVADLLLLVLLGVVFHRWEPLIREGLARWEDGGVVARALAKPPKLGGLTRWARGLLGVGLVLFQRGALVFQGPMEGRLLGRVRALLRPQLQSELASHTPLPGELARALLADAVPERILPRPQLDTALAQSLTAWREAGQRGALLVHGDRGAGKQTWLCQVVERPRSDGLAVVRVGLSARLISEEAVCGWLARALGLPAATEGTVSGLVEALSEHPPSFIVLEELQWAFLRTVHGFDGLRAVLEVVARTGDRHFWLCSIHGPAWRYLTGLGSLLNLQMFRTVLGVPPWTSADLRLLLDGRARSCGAPCSYDDLVRAQPLGGDPEVARERSINGWYRQLAEASHGEPGVALRLWSTALTGDEERVSILPGVRFETRLPEDMRDSELFVLAALRIHDGLTEEELQRVNNLDPMVVRATVKQLEARGLAWHRGERVGVEGRFQPAVTQVLKRRQFLRGRS